MDDSALVSAREADRRLQRDLGRRGGMQGSQTAQGPLEVFTLKQLHYHVGKAGARIRSRVEDLHDVLALDDRARLRFAKEALYDVRHRGELRREQHLHRAALECDDVSSLVDRAHAALAHEPDQLVFTCDLLTNDVASAGIADRFAKVT